MSPSALRITKRATVPGWIVLPTPTGILIAGAGRLFELDPEEGGAPQVASGGWDYDFARLADAGDGTILIASGRTLWRFDPRDRSIVDRHDLAGLGYLDAVVRTRSGTWVTASNGEQNVLARIDLDTGKVLERFPVDQGVHQIAEADGYLFVMSQSYPALVRVDLVSGDMTSIRVGPGSIAVVGSRIWVATDDEVACIYADHLTPCGEIPVARAGSSLSSDGQTLWLLSFTGSKDPSIYLPDPNQPATVTMLDGNTGEILAGPLRLPDHTPATIAAFHEHVWIGFHDTGTILQVGRCDPAVCAA